MSEETQHQSGGQLRKSRKLSLEPTRPPGKVPGYSLQQFLGSGAYGEVWLATDQKTGKRVAVKFYTRRSSADVQLLAREVEKLVVLHADRYVVQLLDVGWDADPPYYVMDYIEHGSLEDALNDAKTMPTAEAVELFQEIATGMMHLHGKGILHCDLKPGNVLLDQDGKPRVADFGQSRLSTEQTAALGTLFYMAPEQADLEALPDARWDVYGLGALLFSMLTGKPPYYSEELAATIDASSDVNTRLSEYRTSINAAPKPTQHRSVAGVDRALADIIDRCIAADPNRRFSSIQSVLFALRQRETTKSRRPLLVLGLLGPLLLMGVMSAFGWQAYQQVLTDTDAAMTEQASESNRFAAKLAARSASEQIDEYFRFVTQLADNEDFKDAFRIAVADEELEVMRKSFQDPHRNNDVSLDELRNEFIADDDRLALQSYLTRRIEGSGESYPEAASWFVNDLQGNQIASAFASAPAKTKNTIGKNYSYRTYFTGYDRDLKKKDPDGNTTYQVDEDPAERVIIDKPHLSAIFLSEGSDTWKFAFSTPIRIGGKIEGIVAVTVEMGSFIEFEDSRFQYAMLVDAREGDNTGVILEHPLFDQYVSKKQRVPEHIVRTKVDLAELDSAFENSTLMSDEHVQPTTDIIPVAEKWFDPVGKHDEGASFSQEHLVARAPVYFRNAGGVSDSSRDETGLYVLTVEDQQAMLAPAHSLLRRLAIMALIASLILLAVAIAMWILVNRMLKESRLRLARAFAPSSESGSLENMETIGLPGNDAGNATL